MNFKKPRPQRHAPTQRSESLTVRFAAFWNSLNKQFRENQRQQKLRRQRKQRLQSKPGENQRWVATRKALNFTWLQRRLQRRQQVRDKKRSRKNRGNWFWPRIAENISTRDAAARVMRTCAMAFLLLTVITLVISALPLKITTPNWYLEVLALIGESIPVLVLACVFAMLSLTLDSDDRANTAYRGKLLSFSRLGYIPCSSAALPGFTATISTPTAPSAIPSFPPPKLLSPGPSNPRAKSNLSDSFARATSTSASDRLRQFRCGRSKHNSSAV